MIETFCKEHKLTTFECTKCQREDFELEHEEELAALREENEELTTQLHMANQQIRTLVAAAFQAGVHRGINTHEQDTTN